MKCPKCNQDITIKLATKVECEKCKILTNISSILTIQCEKCNHVFQTPIQSKSIFSVKKDNSNL